MNSLTYECDENRNVYAVPAGKYRATLNTVSWILHQPGGDHCDCRLLFDIIGPVDYRIRKVYCPNSDSYAELLWDLKAFFTPDEVKAMIKAGGPIERSEVEGRDVDLEVVTKKVKCFKVPYSMIVGIYPPGTLIQDSEYSGVSGEDDDDETDLAAA